MCVVWNTGVARTRLPDHGHTSVALSMRERTYRPSRSWIMDPRCRGSTIFRVRNWRFEDSDYTLYVNGKAGVLGSAVRIRRRVLIQEPKTDRKRPETCEMSVRNTRYFTRSRCDAARKRRDRHGGTCGNTRVSSVTKWGPPLRGGTPLDGASATRRSTVYRFSYITLLVSHTWWSYCYWYTAIV